MKPPYVAADMQRRTCIAVNETDGHIHYIPLSYDNGLELESLPAKEFVKLFPTVMDDYPVERAATLYVQYSHSIGASQRALDSLGQFVKLSAKDIEMASKKPAAKAAAKSAAAKPAAAKTSKVAKTPAAKKEPGAPRESAAAMFKTLIMEGKLTDDKIFEKVAAKFGLDEKKRSYVAWYRNDLVKKGETPPEAK